MNLLKNVHGAIVLGGHVQGLGIVRILGREGIPVLVIDNTNANLAKHSKYCHNFYRIKDDLLFDFLNSLVQSQQYRGWVIFPTNDFHVKLLSQNKQQLEKNFIISTDSWDTVRIFYNKRETYRLAENLQIPIATTFFPENENEIDGLKVKFPCIIKPAVMYDFYKKTRKKVFVCRDMKELKANYNKALELIPAEDVIVQEIINGPSRNQYSSCFLFLNNITYINLIACRMRQHPLDFGNATTYAETIEIPELREYGERILKAVGYNGICEMEFKLDSRDNKYKFLEVNSRTWKWHTIANKAGTPFVKNYFDYLTGKIIQPSEGFSKSAYIHSLTDIPVQLQLFLKGYGYWNRKIRPIEPAVWAIDDPSPWFYEKAYLFFYLFKR
jgi:predicted ATP-grasp superfamily ATP-dependent carboligase